MFGNDAGLVPPAAVNNRSTLAPPQFTRIVKNAPAGASPTTVFVTFTTLGLIGMKVLVMPTFATCVPAGSNTIDTGTVALLPLGTTMAAVGDVAWIDVASAPRVWVSATVQFVKACGNPACEVPPVGANVNVCVDTVTPSVHCTTTSKLPACLGVPFTTLVTLTTLSVSADAGDVMANGKTKATSAPAKPATIATRLCRNIEHSSN